MPTSDIKKYNRSRFTLFSGLGRTLFISLLLFSLLPISVLGLISYKRGHASLLDKEVKSLQAAVNLRAFYLSFYFQERINDLILHADFSENIALLQKLQTAFSKSKLPLNQFLKTYKYISIVTEHGDDIQEFQEMADDYHDILLISLQGDILHSVAREVNLGTNIFNGPYQDSVLAKLSRKTIEMGQTLCSDLSIHESSGNKESIFASQVMVDDEGEMIGIMVMQIVMDQIDSIMTDGSGLGDTGQAFLVGNDSTLRSKLRNDENKAVLSDKLECPLITEWLAREKIRHGPDRGPDAKELPVVSEAIFCKGQSGNPALSLSHDIDTLGIYDLHWTMIAEIDQDEAFGPSRKLGEMILFTLLFTTVLVFFLAAAITRRMILPLTKITEWARNISQGKLEVKVIKTQNNEIGTLYDTLTEMVVSLQTVMSQKDKQDWLKSGEAGLNTAMQGVQDSKTLGQNILNYICNYLQLEVGALFLLQQKSLHLTAGYAYKITATTVQDFAMGEGLVGQAALEKKPILVHDLPDEYFDLQINSGLGISSPKTVFIMPLLQEKEIIGVMEFGTVRDFSEQEVLFLETIHPVIAITLKTVLAGEKVKQLLAETQQNAIDA